MTEDEVRLLVIPTLVFHKAEIPNDSQSSPSHWRLDAKKIQQVISIVFGEQDANMHSSTPSSNKTDRFASWVGRKGTSACNEASRTTRRPR